MLNIVSTIFSIYLIISYPHVSTTAELKLCVMKFVPSFTSSFCFTCALNCQLHRYNLDSFIVLFQVPYTHLETYFVNISFVKIVDQFFVIEFHTHLWHNYMVRIMFHLQLVHVVFHVHIFRFFQKIIFQHLFSYDKIRSQFQQNITNPKFHIYTK